MKGSSQFTAELKARKAAERRGRNAYLGGAENVVPPAEIWPVDWLRGWAAEQQFEFPVTK